MEGVFDDGREAGSASYLVHPRWISVVLPADERCIAAIKPGSDRPSVGISCVYDSELTTGKPEIICGYIGVQLGVGDEFSISLPTKITNSDCAARF